MHVYVDTLNRISPTIDWANPDPEDREEILKILRKRIQSIRCAAQPRMAYQQVLFRRDQSPRRPPPSPENFTPEFGPFPTRKLKATPLTRPYFSRSTDSNNQMGSESGSSDERVPRLSAEIYSEEMQIPFDPDIVQKSPSNSSPHHKPFYSTPSLQQSKLGFDALTTPGSRNTMASTPRGPYSTDNMRYSRLRHSSPRLNTRVPRFKGEAPLFHSSRLLRTNSRDMEAKEAAAGSPDAENEFQGLKNICIEVFNYIYAKKLEGMHSFHKK